MPSLFERPDVQLKAGAQVSVPRSDASHDEPISAVISGGGLAVRVLNGRLQTVPLKLNVKDVEGLRFFSVTGITGDVHIHVVMYISMCHPYHPHLPTPPTRPPVW